MKTTLRPLLRILSGLDRDFLGDAYIAKNIKIGYLAQEPQLDPAKDVAGNVNEGVSEARAVLRRYDELCELLGKDLPAAAEDLGKAIPDHELGVSVCLPLWKHVIGYEEGDQEIVSKFKSGYPRFCCPPAITRLFEAAEKEFAAAGVVGDDGVSAVLVVVLAEDFVPGDGGPDEHG